MQVNYQHDYYSWTQEQAKLLSEKQFGQIDVEHLIEELKAMGAREKRELVSRLRVLLLHLLKWEYQSLFRGNSWQRTIRNQRQELRYHLEDNPGLKRELDIAIQRAYSLALNDAEAETGIPVNTFPTECPWSFTQFMDKDFWPEAKH